MARKPGRPDCFWEKIGHNEAQPIFFSKLIHDFYLGKVVQNLGYFKFSINLPKVSNRPIGEISPNLVIIHISGKALQLKMT
jgi:hypothetical protein